LVEPLLYSHFGDSNPTATPTSYPSDSGLDPIPEIDMRCTVGHLTRNVKLYGTSEDNLGGHLFVYHYGQDPDQGLAFHGEIDLTGVELYNMGQKDSNNAGIHYFHTDEFVWQHASHV
jgi:hypothetical protein